MPHDQTGGREASLVAWTVGLLFVCMLGLLAIADIADNRNDATVAATNLPEIR